MGDLYKQVSSRIDADYYPYHHGEWFTHDDICRFFEWRGQETKKMVSKKLFHEYKEMEKPILSKNGKAYRIIEYDADIIDWQATNGENVLDVELPFGLHKLVKLFPKSLVVIAGASGAGKTALLYNVLRMNMNKHIWTLYNSEMGGEEMYERFSLFNPPIPNPAPFVTRELYDNFSDPIDPDGFSVIDYVDADSEFYNIGGELAKIHRKLRKGIAIVAIQKKRNTKNFKGDKVVYNEGYGGELTKKKATLYVTMDNGQLRIIKGRNWWDKMVNPVGMTWDYKLVNGCKFIVEKVDESN